MEFKDPSMHSSKDVGGIKSVLEALKDGWIDKPKAICPPQRCSSVFNLYQLLR